MVVKTRGRKVNAFGHVLPVFRRPRPTVVSYERMPVNRRLGVSQGEVCGLESGVGYWTSRTEL